MKRVLVTGGAGDIGAAICRRLASDGWHVIVHGHAHRARAEALVAELLKNGASAESCAFDVTDFRACEEQLAALLARGVLQGIVHNAGMHDDAPMAGMTHEQWDSVIAVSLGGFFNVVRPALLPMLGTRWGRIVAVSSIAGLMGNRGQANYAAAKSGLHGAVKSLAVECAARGVTVNAVAPGIIDTPATRASFDDERVKQLVPMKRRGDPREVAALIAFLLGEDAAYVSGQIISINGAMA